MYTDYKWTKGTSLVQHLLISLIGYNTKFIKCSVLHFIMTTMETLFAFVCVLPGLVVYIACSLPSLVVCLCDHFGGWFDTCLFNPLILVIKEKEKMVI